MKDFINNIYCVDNAEFTPNIPDGSLDVILEDPPYLYLKNQKLERPFDELAHFKECYRMLRNGGFIVIFGRGASFYRWNTILADLGFEFKEEIIWNKSYSSSPLMSISRVHETIAIWSKRRAKINKVKVPYLEMKQDDISGICQDIKRLRTILKNTKSLDAVLQFLKNNPPKNISNNLKVSSDTTIIRSDRTKIDTFTRHRVNSDNRRTGDRGANVMQSVIFGLNEKTIIKQPREHYSTIHPTQKPPRLLERLLALVLPQDKAREDVVVADFFGGSCNTAKACISMGVNYIVTEIDKEYYDLGLENVEKFKEEFQPQLFKVV